MTKNDRARDYDSFVALFSIERIRDINSTVREVCTLPSIVYPLFDNRNFRLQKIAIDRRQIKFI